MTSTPPLLTLDGAPVSRLGLGCSQVGSFGNPATPAQSRALIRQALDLGLNHFDTADIYGQGDSEAAIGRALGGRREGAFVVTKFGKAFSAKMRMLRPLKPLLKPLLAARGAGVTAQRGAVMREDFRPARLPQALEASLRRLGMDSVDAVLLHSPPLDVLRDPATEAALAAILASGRARYAGVSVETQEELAAALALPSARILQIPWSLAGDLSDPRMAAKAVFVREIIRLQPELAPRAAVEAALGRADLAGVIVGTRKAAHLAQLAALNAEIRGSQARAG